MTYLVDIGTSRLSYTAARVGGKGLQIAARAFRIKHPKGKGGLARTGYTGDSHNLIQRDVHIDVLQIVDFGTMDMNAVDHKNALLVNVENRLQSVMPFHNG